MNEIEAYIRQSAQAHGIDPDIAVRVANSEGGLHDPVRQSDYAKGGHREPSYGPFQLLIGGAGTGFGGGLGNRALAAGIDPRDPAQWQKAVDFALAEAGKRGWGQWYGAAKAGVGNFTGIGAVKPTPGASSSPYALDSGPAVTVQHPPNPQVGTGGYVAPGAPTTSVAEGTVSGATPVAAVPATDKYGKVAEAVAKGLGAFGGSGSAGPALGGGRAPLLPAAAPGPTPAQPIVSGGSNDPNYQATLAALMQRLNTGRIWG
jgi:hypothetical protein